MKIIISLILVLLFVLIPFTACIRNDGGTSSPADPDTKSYTSAGDSSEPAVSSDAADESEASEPVSKPDVSNAVSSIYSMRLEDIVKTVYAACNKPFDGYINEPIPKEVLSGKYGDELECTETYRSVPFWNVDPYLFELYRVDEKKAAKIAALVEEKADLNQWVYISAEAKIAAVNGNVVMLCMSSREECKKLSEAFTGIK